VIDGPIEGGAVYGALRTYTLQLYQEIGFPAPLKGGQDKKLVGYFQSDTGTINQLLHSGSSMMTPTGERIGGSVREQGIRPRLRPKVSSPAYDPGGKATPGGTMGTAEFANGPLRLERGRPREGSRAMIRATRSPAQFRLVPRA